MELMLLGYGQMAGSCEHSKEHWGFMKCRTFLHQWRTTNFGRRILLYSVIELVSLLAGKLVRQPASQSFEWQMQLTYSTKVSLMFSIIPKHNDTFVPYWQRYKNSTVAVPQFFRYNALYSPNAADTLNHQFSKISSPTHAALTPPLQHNHHTDVHVAILKPTMLYFR
jgi:hypothetical protein